jgi:hypothetical protein
MDSETKLEVAESKEPKQPPEKWPSLSEEDGDEIITVRAPIAKLIGSA